MNISPVSWVPNLSEPRPKAYGINDPFVKRIFDSHGEVRPMLKAGYIEKLKHATYVEANTQLREIDQRLKRHDLKLSMDDEQLVDWCRAKARMCGEYIKRHSDVKSYDHVVGLLGGYGIEFQCQKDMFESDLKRFACEIWWRRQIRTLQAREMEEIARLMRIVHGGKQSYASDYGVQRRRKRQKKNRGLLEQMIATNQDGQEYSLQELADLSVSNPANRRNELMVRMAGFEQVAINRGLVAEFYTLTCPSKYHPITRGKPNGKYNGASAKDSNNYLVKLFSLVRASLARADIQTFGFRVSEPHHDGCAHWHILLFMDAGSVSNCRSIFREYALKEDGQEDGARKHRFKAERIDPSKGSATGYLAKYISKNIDGHGLDNQGDLFYGDEIKNAERVNTWAGSHGIRQFQQIGGASVTVWRELRRLSGEHVPDEVSEIAQAADAADWAAYTELMGGPFCGRSQTLSVAMWQEVNEDTGEILDAVEGRYGDVLKGKIIGLWFKGEIVVTRFFRWSIERMAEKTKELIKQAEFVRPALRRDLNPAGFCRGDFSPPWSSVNKCTG